MDFDAAVVVNKPQFSKFVHEKTHPGPGRSDHIRKRLLADFREDRLRFLVLAKVRQQQEQPLLPSPICPSASSRRSPTERRPRPSRSHLSPAPCRTAGPNRNRSSALAEQPGSADTCGKHTQQTTVPVCADVAGSHTPGNNTTETGLRRTGLAVRTISAPMAFF